MKRPRLESWSIFEGRAYGVLRGEHPSGLLHDGDHVMTTPIVSGPETNESVTTIKTRGGTVYELGAPA